MRSVQFVLCSLLIAAPAVAGKDQASCLDALRQMFPDSESALSNAAKWLEDNYGASTADDLKGVGNFADHAMSLVAADNKLDTNTKKVLKRLFTGEKDGVQQIQVATTLDALKKDFPEVDSKVLQTVAKFLEDNFGASTPEDLAGVSDWAVNGLSLAEKDKSMGADAKITLKLLFQTRSQAQRRLASSSMQPTTTTTTTTVTTTNTVTNAPVGPSFNAKFKVAVTDTAKFLSDMPAAKKVMADAIAAGNVEITSAEMVVINAIIEAVSGGRRLGEQGRRLAAGQLEVDYTVNFPVEYKGTGVTSANTDWSKMKESINNNKHSIAATVVTDDLTGGFGWSTAPTCSGAACGSTPTTGENTAGGAVAAKQLAASVAAVFLMKLLSGL